MSHASMVTVLCCCFCTCSSVSIKKEVIVEEKSQNEGTPKTLMIFTDCDHICGVLFMK